MTKKPIYYYGVFIYNYKDTLWYKYFEKGLKDKDLQKVFIYFDTVLNRLHLRSEKTSLVKKRIAINMLFKNENLTQDEKVQILDLMNETFKSCWNYHMEFETDRRLRELPF